MRLDRRTLLRTLLGVGVSVIAVYVLVSSVDLGRTLEVLGGASPVWIGLMLLTTCLDVGFRGARWRWLLRPIARLPYPRVLGYTLIGYLANNVLPARLGELVRSHVLGEREAISRPTVLGTVVVERVTDTALVVAIAGGAIVLLSSESVPTTAVALGAVFVGVLVIGVVVLAKAHRLPFAARVVAMAERWPRVLDFGRRLREGLVVGGRPETLAGTLLFGVLAWIASIATFWAAGQAVGIPLTPAQAALVCAGVALVTIVPSAPGYLGTFELTAREIVASYGFGREEAFAMALLVHASILFVTSLGGAISFVRLGLGARDLSARPSTGPVDRDATRGPGGQFEVQ